MDYDAPELPAQFSRVMETLKGAADIQGGFVIDYRKTVFNGLCAACVKANATA
jgi:hypothetical protein